MFEIGVHEHVGHELIDMEIGCHEKVQTIDRSSRHP